MGRIEIKQEDKDKIINSLRKNGGNMKETSKDTGIPVATVRQVMLTEEIDTLFKPSTPSDTEKSIMKRDEAIEATLIEEDYTDLQAAQERFIKKVYKLRDAYLDRLLELVDFDTDKKTGKEILELADKIIQETHKEGTATKSSGILAEIAKKISENKK